MRGGAFAKQRNAITVIIAVFVAVGTFSIKIKMHLKLATFSLFLTFKYSRFVDEVFDSLEISEEPGERERARESKREKERERERCTWGQR